MLIWRALNKMKISRVNEYHSIPQLVYLSFSRYIKKIKRLEFWLLSFLLFDVLVKLCLRIDADVLLSCQFQIDEGSKNSLDSLFYWEERWCWSSEVARREFKRFKSFWTQVWILDTRRGMEFSNLMHLLNNRDVTFFPMTPPKKKNRKLTKINTVVLSLPLSDARIINLVLLVLGTSLNLLIILIIVCVPSARTSKNFYIVSLACSSMVILIEPLEEILKWFFDVNMKLNMDYVCIINFDISIITIVVLKFVQYVSIFQNQISFGHVLLKKYTTVKGILLIWSSCIISLAISLHIYDYFEEDMPDIYICITIMFITMPLIISASIDALIIYELKILKKIEGSWRMNELRHYIMLGESIN